MGLPTIEHVLRPAAIVPVAHAVRIVAALEAEDVSKGGIWNATTSIWQRYDRPWSGAAGSRGGAELIGTIAVVYDQPRKHEITIFKVSIAEMGIANGWTPDSLCDDALRYADLSMQTCPRADLTQPPAVDPFRQRLLERKERSIWASDINEVLRTDVRDLREIVGKLRASGAA